MKFVLFIFIVPLFFKKTYKKITCIKIVIIISFLKIIDQREVITHFNFLDKI